MCCNSLFFSETYDMNKDVLVPYPLIRPMHNNTSIRVLVPVRPKDVILKDSWPIDRTSGPQHNRQIWRDTNSTKYMRICHGYTTLQFIHDKYTVTTSAPTSHQVSHAERVVRATNDVDKPGRNFAAHQPRGAGAALLATQRSHPSNYPASARHWTSVAAAFRLLVHFECPRFRISVLQSGPERRTSTIRLSRPCYSDPCHRATAVRSGACQPDRQHSEKGCLCLC